LSCDTGLLGVCQFGTTSCVAGVVSCDQNVPASPEVCANADDENCDGEKDEPESCGVLCDSPNEFAATTKRTVLRLSSTADQDRVLTKGSFVLPPGANFSPDTERVVIEVSDGATGTYTSTLPPGSFVANATRRVFRYRDKFSPFENGGLQVARFSIARDGVTVKYLFKARDLTLPTFTAGAGRVAIRVHDRCFTDSSDTCASSPTGLKCQ
jgi:hypothetical protein